MKFIKWDLANLVEQVRSVCVVADNGCWIWRYGAFDHEWYPEIMIRGERDSVARWILRVTTGRTGEVARHRCDRPPCCNPDDLLWGSQADNVHDAFERGRRVAAQPPPPRRVNRPYRLARGEAHGRSKFTDDEVRAIRQLHAGGRTIYRLAKDHEVTKRCIQQIVRRETWQHL